MVKYFVEAGASINSLEGVNGSTALHEAVAGGHVKIVEYLISKGANQLLRNNSGQVPLHIACLKGDVILIKTLCRGANAKKASLALDNTGHKPHEICTKHYAKAIYEGN